MKHSQNSATLASLLKVLKEERIADDSSAEEQSQGSGLECRGIAQSHQQDTPGRDHLIRYFHQNSIAKAVIIITVHVTGRVLKYSLENWPVCNAFWPVTEKIHFRK